MIRRTIARIFWRCSRWHLVSDPQPPNTTARIIIGGPHTSNWDFVLMIAIAWEAGIPLAWLGKRQLFKGLAGPIMRGLGGIPVDRDNAQHLVAELIERQHTKPFALVITPEGTRAGAKYWKSGFYRIARAADLPVTLGYVDRATMTTGLGPTIDLTGNVRADMDVIRAFYADKMGVIPANRIEPRLREEPGSDQAE